MSNFQLYSQYYDALYKEKDYRQETDYVIGVVESLHPSAKSLLELGCGTGKHAEFFCKKGYAVTGIERSEDMVSLAREKNIKGFHPQVGDITSYKLDERFDVAISLFHVISYLTSNSMLLSCFETTHHHLNQGGLFLFDTWYSPAVYYQKPETRIKRLATEKSSITRLAEPVMHYNQNVVDVNYEIIVKDKSTGNTQVVTEVHPMRHFSIPEIELLANKTGFSLLRAEEFGTGEKPGTNTWGVCFVLQKN